MSVPKFEEMFNPMLRALRAFGDSASIDELDDRVAEYLDLSEEDLLEMGRGKNSSMTKFRYNMGWARSYLKRYGLIENEIRGKWTLTERGRRVHQVDKEEVKRFVHEAYRKPNEGRESNIDDELSWDESSWEDEALSAIKRMSPDAFERLCQRLLRKEGFVEIEITSRNDDGEIVGKGVVKPGSILSFHVHFQCKRDDGFVSEMMVKDFRETMNGQADKGIIITMGTFSRDARSEANDENEALDLIDGIEFVNMLKKYELGISVKERLVEDVEVNEKWFEGF